MTEQENPSTVRDQVAAWAREHGDPFAAAWVDGVDEQVFTATSYRDVPTASLLECIGAVAAFLRTGSGWHPSYVADPARIHHQELRSELRRRMMPATTAHEPLNIIEPPQSPTTFNERRKRMEQAISVRVSGRTYPVTGTVEMVCGGEERPASFEDRERARELLTRNRLNSLGYATREEARRAADAIGRAPGTATWCRIGTLPDGTWAVLWDDGSFTGPNGRIDDVAFEDFRGFANERGAR